MSVDIRSFNELLPLSNPSPANSCNVTPHRLGDCQPLSRFHLEAGLNLGGLKIALAFAMGEAL